MPDALLIRRARLVPLPGTPRPGELADLTIQDGQIIDISPHAATQAPRSTPRSIDADGRWAIPGLWDQHVHLGQWAKTRSRLNLAGTTSASDALRRVAARIASDRASALGAETEPLVGFGHRSAVWPDAPTVAALDAVTGARPTVLISGDAHNGWLNSAALRLLGVAARADALDEDDWFPVFTRFSALPTDREAADRAYPDVVAEAAQRGIVGVTDFEFEAGFARWPDRFAAGVQALRVRTATYADTLDEAIASGLRTGDALPGCGGLVTMGPLKVISDGSLNTRTAYCCAPYADANATTHPRGKLNIAPDELADLLAHAGRHGVTAAVHAIGDAAAAHALDAFATAAATGSLEHAQLMRREDLPRMAALGLTASVQPAHLLDDREVSDTCWPDRGDRCFMLRSMLAAGVPLALGSDAPVAPLDPWLAMAAAVHRSADDRPAWHPAESISAAAALAASVDGQRLRVGGRGDVVLLDDDPLAVSTDPAVAAQRLRAMRVHATVRAGEITHLADGAR